MSQNHETDSNERGKAYWQANLRLMYWLLSIWFIVSFVCGILLVDVLNTIRIGGYPLGFWFAQQGSIYTFLLLIVVYTRKMAALDKEYGLEEE